MVSDDDELVRLASVAFGLLWEIRAKAMHQLPADLQAKVKAAVPQFREKKDV